jgi:hypothetical protein
VNLFKQIRNLCSIVFISHRRTTARERALKGGLSTKSLFAFILCFASSFFMMPSTLLAQRSPVNLRSAGNYVVLS